MSNLEQNSVMLVVRLSKPGNRRKVSSAMVEVDADREAISVGKELLDCAELAAVSAHDGTIRRYIYARSLLSSILKEGVYRLPLTLVEEVEAGLRGLRDRRTELIGAFLDVYPEKAAEARGRLRALYDPGDYPVADVLRRGFDMQWRYLSLDVPKTLDTAFIEQERAKAALDIQREADEIKMALRQSFAALVEHAADKLRVGPDGKRLTFRDSLVQNMEQFLTYFSARNLTGDQDLAVLVERARSVMHGVTPEELRDQDGLRQTVQKAMAEIKTAIDQGAMLKPSRMFTLEPAAV